MNNKFTSTIMNEIWMKFMSIIEAKFGIFCILMFL